MAGRMPLDRLITRYDFADINRAAADATSGQPVKSATNYHPFSVSEPRSESPWS
jgi:Zn-dependent alcohol dehydrogenase